MAVKYFENNRCFVAVGNKLVLDLTSVAINGDVATDDLTTFEQMFQKVFQPTFQTFTVDCKGFISDRVTGHTAYTGSTVAGTLTGTTNGLQFLETLKNNQNLKFCLRIDASNVQRTSCLITSYGMNFDVGKAGTYTLKLQLLGNPVKTTT